MRCRWILVLSVCLGCGASKPAVEEPRAEVVTVDEPYISPRTEGQIPRADLIPILDAGLGRFLQGVGTEPHLKDNAFVGFRLTKLYPNDERFEGIGIGPGDTVVRVNGQSIERPEQAQQVWEGLRVSSELWIEFLRDGQPKEVRFSIVD